MRTQIHTSTSARLFNPCAIDAAATLARQAQRRLAVVRRIGDAPDVLAAIEAAFSRLVAQREGWLGEDAYAATLSAFKRDFGMAASDSWDTLCRWPLSRATQVLHYLNGRYAESLGRTPETC
jgi:hypothetical protein